MEAVKIGNIKKSTTGTFPVIGTITRKERTQRSTWREHALSTLEDETGSMLLNLWRDQIDQVQVGDKIFLKAAFAKSHKGSYQLSTWEEKIEVLEHVRNETKIKNVTN